MFPIKPRIFNISNIFSSSFLHSMQIMERTDVFSKMYDYLGFSNFLYLPQTMQYNFPILNFLVIWYILVLSFHSSHNY